MWETELLMLFNNNSDLIEIGIPALRIIALHFIGAAIGIMFSTFFQGIGNGKLSLLISVLRQIGFLLPAAYFLSKLGLTSVWFAFPISETAALVINFVLMLRTYRKQIKPLSPPNQV